MFRERILDTFAERKPGELDWYLVGTYVAEMMAGGAAGAWVAGKVVPKTGGNLAGGSVEITLDTACTVGGGALIVFGGAVITAGRQLLREVEAAEAENTIAAKNILPNSGTWEVISELPKQE